MSPLRGLALPVAAAALGSFGQRRPAPPPREAADLKAALGRQRGAVLAVTADEQNHAAARRFVLFTTN